MQEIPSILYKSEIARLCLPLKAIGNISCFVSYMIFNDGKSFVISNLDEEFLQVYWDQELHKQDRSTDLNYFSSNTNMYLGRDIDSVGAVLKETLEQQFNLHRTFYMTRSSPECRFVFGALHKQPINQPNCFYQAVKNEYQDFCINFIDDIIPLIKAHHPNYSRSFILNDKAYRSSVLKMECSQDSHLTEREIESLYWAIKGKSSEETAIIMNISKYTVEDFRKNIKRKLNCSTLAQAVYESIKRGYIGAFHNLIY